MLIKIPKLFVLALVLCWSSIINADITVGAAASLTNALTEIGQLYESKTQVKVKNSFASSSALAKQIENGMPIDLFISADEKWMDYLAEKNKIDTDSRMDLLGNSLVLIAPKEKSFSVKLQKGSNLGAVFNGKLCTGETETVPVGKYAKQALQNLGLWDSLKGRIVGTEDVRSALAFVERAECSAGIVYKTDALSSDKVIQVDSFPNDSHTAIVYPAALISQAEQAKAFLTFLTEAEAKSVFEKYGFTFLVD